MPNARMIFDISYICGADVTAFDRHPAQMHLIGRKEFNIATIPSVVLRLDLEENKGGNGVS